MDPYEIYYYYKVSASDEVPNEGVNSTVVIKPPDMTPPPKVTAVKVTVVPSGNKLNLEWSDLSVNTSDLVGYSLYRSTTPSFTPSPASYMCNTTNNYYNDTGLIDGVTYYYRISAYDEIPNYGSFSDQANGHPLDTTPPEQITGLTITPKPEGNALNLSWSPSDAPDLVEYKIYRSLIQGGPFILLATSVLNLYTDTNLTDAIIYYYKISAVDEVPNEGLNSTPASGSPADITPPAQVTGFVIVSAANGNELDLSWTASGATDFDHYNIYRSNFSSTGPYELICTSTSNSYNDFGLDDAHIYYYKVSAVDDGGPTPNEGANSTVKSGIPMDLVPPGKINIVTVVDLGTGDSLNITWTPRTEPDVVCYKIYRSTTPGFTPNPTNLIASPTGNYYLDSSLSTGITYYYCISAVDEVPNEGPPSDETFGTPS